MTRNGSGNGTRNGTRDGTWRDETHGTWRNATDGTDGPNGSDASRDAAWDDAWSSYDGSRCVVKTFYRLIVGC